MFVEQDSGKLLRLVERKPGLPPSVDSSGNADVTLDGNGPPVENSYSGTGFLVTADGKILTNRHVGEPWWANAQAERIISSGFRGEHRRFVAYFPHRSQAFTLKTLRVSKNADAALLETTSARDLPKPIPLEEGPDGARAGEPVVLIGYPLGLEAMLARFDSKEIEKIPNYMNLTMDQVARELAKRDMIHPFVSQGHISNITRRVLTYDAVSTMGGSGGPLFSRDGKVIGIHFANLTEFAGGNLGVPIQHALALLRR